MQLPSLSSNSATEPDSPIVVLGYRTLPPISSTLCSVSSMLTAEN